MNNAKDVVTQADICRLFFIPIFSFEEPRRLVAYLNGRQAQVSQLRTHLQETHKGLDVLISSILDKTFKGEL